MKRLVRKWISEDEVPVEVIFSHYSEYRTEIHRKRACAGFERHRDSMHDPLQNVRKFLRSIGDHNFRSRSPMVQTCLLQFVGVCEIPRPFGTPFCLNKVFVGNNIEQHTTEFNPLKILKNREV